MDFSFVLVTWYEEHKRDLPWRRTLNPYKIWLSEIILQQTRVAQGLPYYNNFLTAFPTITDLALATEDEVLKLWQGLGYYSRARNLHFSARFIAKNYNGVFPTKYDDILSLKGVGVYTAAAIASFSKNLPYAVVDGNVIRVLSRIFGISVPFDTSIGKKEFQKLAQKLLSLENPGLHNQAIMEFGALQCVSKSPNCNSCVFLEDCVAFNENNVQDFPVKSRTVKVKNRFLNYFVVNYNDGLFIKKRKAGIWNGLYEFPVLEFPVNLPHREVIESLEFNSLFKSSDIKISKVSLEFIHNLSHQKLHVKFWEIYSDITEIDDYKYIKKSSLKMYPVSRLIERYIQST